MTEAKVKTPSNQYPTANEGDWDMSPAGDEELLTRGEIAQRMRLGERTITRWVREGRLPCHRLGGKILRFRWSEIVARLATGRMNQKPKRKRQC